MLPILLEFEMRHFPFYLVFSLSLSFRCSSTGTHTHMHACVRVVGTKMRGNSLRRKKRIYKLKRVREAPHHDEDARGRKCHSAVKMYFRFSSDTQILQVFIVTFSFPS